MYVYLEYEKNSVSGNNGGNSCNGKIINKTVYLFVGLRRNGLKEVLGTRTDLLILYGGYFLNPSYKFALYIKSETLVNMLFIRASRSLLLMWKISTALRTAKRQPWNWMIWLFFYERAVL